MRDSDDVAFFAAVFDTEPTIAAVNKRLTSFVYRDCPTVRRLDLARRMCCNAQDSTAHAMADRLVSEWWPGADCSLFVRTLPPKLKRRKAHSLRK